MAKKLNHFVKSWRKFLRNFHLTARKLTIGVIIAAVVAVAGVVALSLFMNPEAKTKRLVEKITRDYYENYTYDKIKNSVAIFEEIMPKYATTGLSPVSLRQLLLYNNGKYLNKKDELGKYCDLDATSVVIYPEEPYESGDYRVEYKYSCNF